MTVESLKAALYAPHWSPATFVVLSCIAFVLGAIHALGPGHGKSLALAYFGGAGASLRHVVLFAFSVTIAHVLVVFVVGLAALWLTDLYWPDTAAKYLGILSGSGIIAVGAHLLSQGLGNARGSNLAKAHDHTHWPADHRSIHEEGALGWWRAVALGFSGGVVPCPKAIVILLLAISLHRIGEGLFLIGAFSLGIAATLLAVGLAAVRVREAVLPRVGSNAMRILPVGAAVLIVLLGAVVLVRSALLL